MSQDSIFSGTPATPEAPKAANAPTTTPPEIKLPPEASEFIGEGKKYATLEDALRSIPHAQKHIQTLEQEAKEIRERLEAQQTLKAMLEEARSNPPEKPTVPTAPAIDPANLTQIVNQTIEQREAQKRAEANVSSVVSTFQTKFGDKAEEVYEALAKENGLTLSSLNQLAATSPNVLFKLAGIDSSKAKIPAALNSSVNTEAFRTNNPQGELSARVGPNPSTKKMVEAWKIAGEKVRNRLPN